MPSAFTKRLIEMRNVSNHHSAVTPVTAAGDVDEAALDQLIDFQLAGSVEGVFVPGTTGEGPSVPRASRLRMVDSHRGKGSKS